MTSPWNTFPDQRAVPGGYPAQQAYAATQTLPPRPQYAPPTQALPRSPQLPPPPHFDYGFPQQVPQPPRPNRTALLVSLVVAAVLLVGGGVTAFLLLSNKSESNGPVGPGTATSASSTAATGATISSIGSATTATATPSNSHSSSAHSSTTGQSSTGNGDLATAEALITTWVDVVNEGDMETASALVCEAQRDEFRNSDPPAGELELLDLAPAGDNIEVTLGIVDSSTDSDQYLLTMRPTDTGYFLICDGPLSEADLNW